MSYIFQSGLAADLQSMIDYKVSIGYSENTYLQNSISLDRYCMKYFPEISLLTQEMVTGWLERRPKESPTAFHVRVCYIRGFGKYLKNVGKEAYVVPEKFTSSKTRFIPYIFTDDELSALFHAIDTYPYDAGDELQPYLFSTIFRMIYTCGLRPNEGRTLRRDAVNLKTGELLITETKCHKERIVIMSDDMKELAVSYVKLRDAAYPDSPYFFPNKTAMCILPPGYRKDLRDFLSLPIPMLIVPCFRQSVYTI